MKALNTFPFVSITAFAAMVGIAYAAPPPNVVESDGFGNTAMGTGALSNLIDGYENTATGFNALLDNTTGHDNTAAGYHALAQNTTGFDNTATGPYALYSNTTGSYNTAAGYLALPFNTTGEFNTATGYSALYLNTTGFDNTATGIYALYSNSEGNANTASGSQALFSNTTGRNNVAIGNSALLDNTTGRNNIAIGWYAGRRSTGNDNILIAHKGVVGESQTMRLGVKGTAGVAGSGITRTYIAGIKGVTTGLAGSQVLIDANGQLGTISSSREVKENIRPMGTASERLLALHPVMFQYKQASDDGSKPIQFGLIAEDVADVFPELVVYNEKGKPETVAYHLLPSLLLNEVQKEHQLIRQQAEQLTLQQGQLAAQASQLAEVGELKRQLAGMQEVLARLQMQSKEEQVAMK